MMLESFYIDRYRVTAVLGRGGHGTVYLATDEKLHREVAVKVLNPELMNDEQAVARFQREARAIARLHHPNILELYDFSDERAAVAYMVTERLLGDNLHAMVSARGKGLPTGVAAAVVHEVCLGLRHAHEQQLIHRDVKPENVFVEKHGRVVLCDFGIARVVEASHLGAPKAATQLLGSPLYMAPEQINGAHPLGPATDIWALGAVLYYLGAARSPFVEDTVLGVFKRIIAGAHHDMPKDWPRPYRDLVARCLSVDPAARPTNTTELAKELATIAQQAGFADPRTAARSLGDEVTGPDPAALEALATLSPEERTLITQLTATHGKARTEKTVVGSEANPKLLQVTQRNDKPELNTDTRTHVSTLMAAAPNTMPTAKPSQPLPFVVLLLALAGALALAYFIAHDDARERPQPSFTATSPAVQASAPPTPEFDAQPASLPAPSPTPSIAVPALAIPAEEPAPIEQPKPKRVDVPPGTLKLIALPWANVVIDGKKMGTTPAFRVHSLGAGKHTLVLSHPSYPNLTKDFVIEPNRELRLVFDLEHPP